MQNGKYMSIIMQRLWHNEIYQANTLEQKIIDLTSVWNVLVCWYASASDEGTAIRTNLLHISRGVDFTTRSCYMHRNLAIKVYLHVGCW
jgi:hypothetical protein